MKVYTQRKLENQLIKLSIISLSIATLNISVVHAEDDQNKAEGSSYSTIENAEENEQELQDMSDPLAVYTQAGLGLTNKGINIKLGKSYDPGTPNTMAMNLIEIKGLLGDHLGWDSADNKDNSIDSIRFRNFKVDMSNGRGGQFDFNYHFDENHLAKRNGDISYSIMQALPKMGRFNIYPLAGLGVSFGNDVVKVDGSVDSGFSVNGTFALVGLYGKMTITDKIWLNYNPFWLTALSGTSVYKDHAYGKNNASLFTHEFAVNYQINPRLNIRYFANWNENVNFDDGDHRLEANYQF
ncbi:MAG: hypothetical protein MJK12_17370 [Colwellia sp.]|nr:hypothetical protein [Colwellia sp.]